MHACPLLNPEQRSAAKPWGIALLAAWTAQFLSFLGLAIYVSFSPPVSMPVIILWAGATLIAMRLFQIFYNRRLKRIVGNNLATHDTYNLVALAMTIAFFTVSFLLTAHLTS